MSVKLLGSMLVMLSGILASLFSIRSEQKKLAILDAWIGLLIHIRTQIDCYLMTIDDILATAPRTILFEGQKDGEAATLEALFSFSKPYLERDALHLLEAFAKEIGGSYREEQLRRCDYYISSLRAIREQLAAALPSRIKVSRALCLCLSVGTAILLW